MATTYKVLGAKTTASYMFSFVPLYTVPTGKTAVISSLVVANPSGTPTNIAVQFVPEATSSLPISYLVGPNLLAANTRVAFTEGWTLGPGDAIYVDDESGDMHYTLFGSEIG